MSAARGGIWETNNNQDWDACLAGKTSTYYVHKITVIIHVYVTVEYPFI